MKFTRLRDLRDDAEKTQEEIAKYLGCSKKTYYRYERGISEISCARFILLAQYYNVSCDYIAGRSKEIGQFSGRFLSMDKRLFSLRRQHHLTQDDISEKLFCSRENYSQYETGERIMPLDMTIILADLYQVSLDYLLLGT